jgi:hypothetical protein
VNILSDYINCIRGSISLDIYYFIAFLLSGAPAKQQSKTTAAAVQPQSDQIKGAASVLIEKPSASMLTQICIRSLTFRTCLN